MDITYRDGSKIHLSLVAKSSYIECVDPLVIGKARNNQFYYGNNPEDVHNVVPILLHGNMTFVGQGMVYETM